MSLTHYEPGRAAAPSLTERDIVLIERQSKIIAQTDIAGPLKGKPADIALVGMKALALGVPVAAAFDDFYVIERRVTISARMRVGLARAAGCEVWFDESSDQAATCCLRRPHQTRTHRLTYTIEQARTAGLLGRTNWKQHPAAMLRAAASRQLINMAAQDVLIGLPGGEGIDYEANVEELDGPEDVVNLSADGGLAEGAPLAAGEGDVDRLYGRISDLDDDQKAWLRDRMKATQLPPVSRLHADQVAAVEALISTAEAVGQCDTDEVGGDAPETDEQPGMFDEPGF